MPSLGGAELALEICEPGPSSLRNVTLRVSVNESSKLGQSPGFAVGPLQIKIYQSVRDVHIVFCRNPRQTLHRLVQGFGAIALTIFRVQFSRADTRLGIVGSREDNLLVRREGTRNLAAHHHRILL